MNQLEAYKSITNLIMSKEYSPAQLNDVAVSLNYLGFAIAELEKKKEAEEAPIEMEPSPSDTGTRAEA